MMQIEITLETLEAAVEACHAAALHTEAAATAYAAAGRPGMAPEEQAALQRLVAQQQQTARAYRAAAEALASARTIAAEKAGRMMQRGGKTA